MSKYLTMFWGLPKMTTCILYSNFCLIFTHPYLTKFSFPSSAGAMNSARPPAAWEAGPAGAGPPQQGGNATQGLPPLSTSSGPPMAVAGPSTPVLAAPPPIPGDTQELPPELVAQGWRRLWSRRENRHYFWNHHTNQSLWDLPPLPGAPRQQVSRFPVTSSPSSRTEKWHRSRWWIVFHSHPK